MPQPQQHPDTLTIRIPDWTHSQRTTATVRKLVGGRSVLVVPNHFAQLGRDDQQPQPVTWLDPDGDQHVLVEEAELVTALRVTLDQPDVRTFVLQVDRNTELLSYVLRHDRMPDLEVRNGKA